MKKAMEKFRSNFAATRESERGDIVQTLLIIVTFVIIVVAVGSILWKAIQGRAESVSDCIGGANPIKNTNTEGC